MFFTYLGRELAGRRKQTIIIATGMALAIALVIIVNSFAQGVKSAQAKVLESVYGVGTDMTVTLTPVAPTEGMGPQQFDFGRDAGSSTDGTQSVSQSRLSTGGGPGGSQLMPSSDLSTVQKTSGVKAASATLSLENTTFSGEIPQASQTTTTIPGGEAAGPGQMPAMPQTQTNLDRGGTDGNGGSSFSVDRFSVLGVDVAADAIGPLSTISLTDGVALSKADVGTYNALVDATYATDNSLAVGGTINIGGQDFTIVGLVTNSTSDSSTSSDVYIPLDVAQTLSGNTDKISTIYVQAENSTQISSIQTALQKALPTDTVKTQADLASSVSGSLTTASTLLDGLGFWLSIAVLIAAFLIAILFTISGVTRRTREFGTLKAIGWRNGRITGQVVGESFVQSVIGGVIGVVLGVVGIFVINAINPTLDGSASTRGGFGGFGPGGQMPDMAQQAQSTAAATAQAGQAAQSAFGPGGGQNPFAAATQTVAIHLPFAVDVVLIAVGLAVVGGLLAGAFGGWRASRLSPAAALRSVN